MENSNEEFEELLKKVKNTDFSYKNPKIQNLIEKKIEEWIVSWENKKEGKIRADFYGRLEDMPKEIDFEGEKYTPYEILKNVSERNEVGIKIIKTIKEYQTEFPIYYGEAFPKILRETINTLGKGDLENIVNGCMCGKHNKTGRDILNEVINIDEESLFLTTGLKQSIKRLYSPDLDLLWFLGKPEYDSKFEEKYESIKKNKNIFQKFYSLFKRKEKPFQILKF